MRRSLTALIVVTLAAVSIAPGAAAATGEIVGGRPATTEYPYMVSLQQVGDPGRHFCGGSLIKKNRVLTAAHCVEETDPETIQVMIGSTKLSEPGRIFAIKKIDIHPVYAERFNHDVAVLQLRGKARQTPVRIASAKQRALWEPGKTATVIGWGRDAFTVGSTTDDLHEVEVPIVSDDDCARSYSVPFLFSFDPTSEVCAGETTGGRDACQGDSGGPLLVPDRGTFVQVGVVSWGIGCAYPGMYGVYARVADPALRDWVAQQVPGKL